MENANTKNIDTLTVKVKFLDDRVDIFTVNINSVGSELFQKVSLRMKLIEDYFFGLSFTSVGSDLCWLDLRKALRKQVNINNEYMYDFCVKFYTPDPNMIHDDLTKQLFILQLQSDLSRDELICCDSTRILLGAFFLHLRYPSNVEQERSVSQGFLKQLFTNSSTNLLEQSLEFYETLRDQSAEQTEFDLLETVRKIDFYGMKMHPAKDIEGVSLSLAVYHMGIVVFQKCTKINTFNWSKIRKLSFKRKRFLIKLHSEEYLELFIIWLVQGVYKDTLEFYFDTRNSCKNFWKKCIEHHSFFRSQSSVSSHESSLGRIHGLGRNFSGSRFRYIGPTQTELDQRHRQSIARNNCCHRSESAGRLMSRDISFTRLARRKSSNKYDSINCLSFVMEPSSPDCIDYEILNRDAGNIPVSTDSTNSPWSKLGAVSDNGKYLPGRICDSVNPNDGILSCTSDKSSESNVSGKWCMSSQIRDYCSRGDGGLIPGGGIPSICIKDRGRSDSLIMTNEIKTDAENQCILTISFPCDQFHSYEFIPKLLAQALSSDECSYEFPVTDINQSTHFEGSTNNGSNTRSLVSTSINSDSSSCFSILNSMIKDFLFNEFTHAKEMQVLKEIIDTEGLNKSEIVGLLDPLISATETLIFQLELRVQVNTQSIDNYLTSANRFLLIVDEFLSRTLEIFKQYVHCVEDFVNCVPAQTSPPICLHSHQLQYLTKSLFHARNPLRLLLSVPFHQRNRHKCIVTIYDFLLTREEDKGLCNDVMTKLKPTLITIGVLEEKCHKLLLMASIEGTQELRPKRFGWLQRLSSKGASNRLFAVTSQDLICVKKFQSNAFIVEQSWKLEHIRVGTISEATSYANGYNVATYPLELVTIVLCLTTESSSNPANVVLLADSKKSQSIWITEIKDAKEKCVESTAKKTVFLVGETLVEGHNILGPDWVQDYHIVEMCWHERVSLSWDHIRFLFQVQYDHCPPAGNSTISTPIQLVLSSYVLRKYKLSSSWQRLWIVLSDCHLYFYRNHSDREAVTSLSLIGFQIMEPSLDDSINKDWVMKLTKDTRVYFLRAENQYFYLRWRTALQHCTSFVR